MSIGTDALDLDIVAGSVLSALSNHRQIPSLSHSLGLSIANAYRLTALLRAAFEARGEKITGRKIGFTNRTRRRQCPVMADCSLIPGLSVKLSMIILARLTVLSAVGARPPHDGVRRRWWINVAIAVSLLKSSQKIGRPHHRHRPGWDVFSRFRGSRSTFVTRQPPCSTR